MTRVLKRSMLCLWVASAMACSSISEPNDSVSVSVAQSNLYFSAAADAVAGTIELVFRNRSAEPVYFDPCPIGVVHRRQADDDWRPVWAQICFAMYDPQRRIEVPAGRDITHTVTIHNADERWPPPIAGEYRFRAWVHVGARTAAVEAITSDEFSVTTN